MHHQNSRSKPLSTAALAIICAGAFTIASAHPVAAQEKAEPVFKDGMAQIVPAFQDSTQWIHQELWVETGFDTDGDGKPDRMHVDVTRPRQTETEGLKVAVIYESSPYFSGTSGPRQYLWNMKQEVDAPPTQREHQPEIPFKAVHPRISNDLINEWVPRGFAVVHSEAPGQDSLRDAQQSGTLPSAWRQRPSSIG